MNAESCTLEGPDGVLAYAVAGAGPPALFIQGVSVHGAGWQPQTDVLARDYRCLWFDNRGIGGSTRQAKGLSIESMAEDALALIDDQGWESAHVLGHSMGGAIAQALALEHPERVRSLSLLCTFARFRDSFTATRRLLPLSLRTRLGTRRMRRHAFLEMVMAPDELLGVDRDARAAELAAVFGHDLGAMPSAAMQQAGALSRFDSRARLAELAAIPTLVVSAEYDPIAPPGVGRRLAEGIPGSRFEIFAGASHGVPITRAKAVNDLLSEHLGTAEAGTGC